MKIREICTLLALVMGVMSICTHRAIQVWERPVVALTAEGRCDHVLTVEKGWEEKHGCLILPFVGSHDVYPVADEEAFEEQPTWAEIDAARREFAARK